MNNAVYFEQIKQLVELQKVDDAIHTVRQDMERAPSELDSLEQRFSASETQRNYIVDKLTHLQDQQKRLSLEIDDDSARINQSNLPMERSTPRGVGRLVRWAHGAESHHGGGCGHVAHVGWMAPRCGSGATAAT